MKKMTHQKNSYKDKGIYSRQRLGILKNSTASIFSHMGWRETHDTSCHGNEKVPEPKFQLDPTSKKTWYNKVQKKPKFQTLGTSSCTAETNRKARQAHRRLIYRQLKKYRLKWVRRLVLIM